MKPLTDEQESEIGRKLADMMFLKKDKDHSDRYKTKWGSKTPLGLYRTVLNVIEQAKPEYQQEQKKYIQEA